MGESIFPSGVETMSMQGAFFLLVGYLVWKIGGQIEKILEAIHTTMTLLQQVLKELAEIRDGHDIIDRGGH